MIDTYEVDEKSILALNELPHSLSITFRAVIAYYHTRWQFRLEMEPEVMSLYLIPREFDGLPHPNFDPIFMHSLQSLFITLWRCFLDAREPEQSQTGKRLYPLSGTTCELWGRLSQGNCASYYDWFSSLALFWQSVEEGILRNVTKQNKELRREATPLPVTQKLLFHYMSYALEQMKRLECDIRNDALQQQLLEFNPSHGLRGPFSAIVQKTIDQELVQSFLQNPKYSEKIYVWKKDGSNSLKRAYEDDQQRSSTQDRKRVRSVAESDSDIELSGDDY
jgi:hypothetical protein